MTIGVEIKGCSQCDRVLDDGMISLGRWKSSSGKIQVYTFHKIADLKIPNIQSFNYDI